MAVTIAATDRKSSVSVGATPLDFTFAAGANATYLMVGTGIGSGSPPTLNSVTFNGVAMTQLQVGTTTGTIFRAWLHGLLIPAGTTAALVWNWTGGTGVPGVAHIRSFNNANLVTGSSAITVDNGGSATTTVTVTGNSAARLTIDSFVSHAGFADPTVGTNQVASPALIVDGLTTVQIDSSSETNESAMFWTHSSSGSYKGVLIGAVLEDYTPPILGDPSHYVKRYHRFSFGG